MGKNIQTFTYQELLAERERIENAIRNTKSIFTKKDYRKYLGKINKEISTYEKNIKNKS